VVAAVDGASHALDGVVQGFVLTWPINAAFLAAAGARANRAVLPSRLGWKRAGGRDAGRGCAAQRPGRRPLFLVFVLWVGGQLRAAAPRCASGRGPHTTDGAGGGREMASAVFSLTR
jgi:hypothetical protein